VKKAKCLHDKHVYVLGNQPARANLQRWSIFDHLTVLEEFEADVPTKGDAILTHSDGPRPGAEQGSRMVPLRLVVGSYREVVNLAWVIVQRP
jgi:hypothetical protein